MAAQKQSVYVPLETYLAWEEKAETKSEYYDGAIVAMTGVSYTHTILTTNLVRRIGNQLEGRPCRALDSSLRVYVEACRSMFYPDITAICGTPQLMPTGLGTLLNPALIVEVLSPSTMRTDRGYKFDCYRSLASLAAYVLVAQDEPRIEAFTRQTDGTWRYDAVSSLEAVLRLDCIGCELCLAQIYAHVEFSLMPEAEADHLFRRDENSVVE